MALSAYTTFDNIRAVLGVNSDELQDTTISLEVYEFNLTEDLEAVALGIPDQYATVADLPDSRTAPQERFYRAVRLFATYSVAKQLLTGLPMFGPKEITDGKSAVTRFALDPYKETARTVLEQYQVKRDRLAQTYAELVSAAAPSYTAPTLLVASSPSSDPVTGT